MKRTTTAKTLAVAAITVLALGIAPLASADNKGCTNETLKGTFVHTASGFETAPPAIAGPLVGVGTDTFDGKGGMTTTATLSINGNIVPVSIAGTYTVNPDCTGTATIGVYDQSGNLLRTGVLAGVYVNNGKEVRDIFESLTLADGTSLPVVITAEATKQ